MIKINTEYKILNTKYCFAFTLIELLLTIALIFIVAGSSTAFYSRFLTQNSAVTIQDQIVGSLRKAQINAMMGKQNSDWGVYIESTGAITLFSGASYSTRTVSFDEKYPVPTSASVTPVEIIFSRITGIPSWSGTITISTTGTTKTVIINEQGMVTR